MTEPDNFEESTGALSSRMTRLDSALDRLDESLDRADSSLDKLDGALDRTDDFYGRLFRNDAALRARAIAGAMGMEWVRTLDDEEMGAIEDAARQQWQGGGRLGGGDGHVPLGRAGDGGPHTCRRGWLRRGGARLHRGFPGGRPGGEARQVHEPVHRATDVLPPSQVCETSMVSVPISRGRPRSPWGQRVTFWCSGRHLEICSGLKWT